MKGRPQPGDAEGLAPTHVPSASSPRRSHSTATGIYDRYANLLMSRTDETIDWLEKGCNLSPGAAFTTFSLPLIP
jgi:hypothetical protein